MAKPDYHHFRSPQGVLFTLARQTLLVPGRVAQSTWGLMRAEKHSWGMSVAYMAQFHPFPFVGTRRSVGRQLVAAGYTPI